MDVQAATHRWLSPLLFALIVLSFVFLPFATVETFARVDPTRTFTAIQAVSHTGPAGGVDVGFDMATFALAAALAGVLLGLFGIARGPGWAAAFGLFATPLEQPSPQDYDHLFVPDFAYHLGFYVPPLLFGFLGLLHIRRAYRRLKPRQRPPGALSVHVNALLFYAFAALVSTIFANEPRGLAHSVGLVALAWLGLAVAPMWLALGIALRRWQKAGRPDLPERAARWDVLLLLGPLLALALIPGMRVRAFLLPPPPIPGDGTSADSEHMGRWSVVKLP